MPKTLFTEAQKKAITDAIAQAEKLTSGEIRIHIEERCKEDVLDHAAFIFEKLGMHKTELRNGVLFYISYEDHKLAILGDAGINAVVPENFWGSIKDHLIAEFKNGNYTTGLCTAVNMAGIQLSAHFPKGINNPNELSNEISFGSNPSAQ
jgi:uncharacterized membrane protein